MAYHFRMKRSNNNSRKLEPRQDDVEHSELSISTRLPRWIPENRSRSFRMRLRVPQRAQFLHLQTRLHALLHTAKYVGSILENMQGGGRIAYRTRAPRYDRRSLTWGKMFSLRDEKVYSKS